MARERLKDFLGSRGGGDQLTFAPDPGANRAYDPGEDDLGTDVGTGQPIRPLLRDFLAYVTDRNDYAIAPGGEEVVLTTPEGDPAPLTSAESTGAERVFVRADGLQEYSDSGRLTRFTGDRGFVDKTRGKGGNELLPGVAGTGVDKSGGTHTQTTPGDRVPTVVESSLRVENRYTSARGEQFAPPGTTPEDIDSRGISIPEILGEFKRAGETASFDELRRIGTSLMLKAARVDTGRTPETSIDVDRISTVSKQVLVPDTIFELNPSNISSRVDTNILTAGSADGGSKLSQDRSSDILTSDAKGRLSYGVMNSPATPFNGPLPAAMISQAAIGIAKLGTASAIIGTILSLVPLGARANPARGPFFSGRNAVPSYTEAALASVGVTPDIIGLISTKNPYGDCVKAGVLTFFGAGGGGTSSLTGLAGSVLQSPGYYVVIIRSILRSYAQVEQAFKDFDGSSVAQAIVSTAALADTIRRSRLVGYMNALAAIGDNVLANAPVGFSLSLESFGISVEEGPPSTIPANRVTLSREGASPQTALGVIPENYRDIYTGSKGRLAWRHGSAAAAMLVPKTVFEGQQGIVPDERAVVNTNIIDSTVVTAGKRLDSKVVQDIEAYLDAEYMPFYFHDLRTNEVIGFHAFLDSLDDNYNIEVSGESTFGRLDPVQIYRGTTRSVSLGFNIVATSESDFDEMWYRINKLVTLAYPQWTPGDEVIGNPRAGGWKPQFKVPFSQVVGASPLIRLRVGDVISSNYSKFGLSRLFGGGDDSTVLSEDNKNKRLTRFTPEDLASRSQHFFAPDTLEARSYLKNLEKQPRQPVLLKPSMGNSYQLVDGFALRPIRTQFPIKCTADFTAVISKTLSELGGFAQKGLAKDSLPLIQLDVTVVDDRYSEINGKSIRVTVADLMLDPDNSGGILPTGAALGTQVVEQINLSRGGIQATDDFFSSDNNALVRAFETTRGKGLAGMLTSLKFTWLDQNNLWEVTRGSRAPLSCKISLGMSVIHDLPLGLGHDGFMMSPAYPVGNTNRRFFGTQYTGPTQEYDVPVSPGSESLKSFTRNPKVINNSAPTADEMLRGAADAVANAIRS
jgi:hypothetical protein